MNHFFRQTKHMGSVPHGACMYIVAEKKTADLRHLYLGKMHAITARKNLTVTFSKPFPKAVSNFSHLD